jgi:hypothetical protein
MTLAEADAMVREGDGALNEAELGGFPFLLSPLLSQNL